MKIDSNVFKFRRLSSAPCNKIIILKSLHPNDLDTADYIHKHITDSVNVERLKKGEFAAVPILIELDSKLHLINLLEGLKKDCLNGTSPIIHLETHGCEGHGLAIFSGSGGYEVISWDELIFLFREINTACNGNLMVVLAACHSYEIERRILKQQRPSPFFALIGYEETILPDDIKLDLAFLYDSLLLENTLPYDSDNSMEKFTLYTEYTLALSLISVLLMNLSSPTSVQGLIPTFEQFSTPPNPLSHLSLEKQLQEFESLVKSEKVVQQIAEAFMQNRQNAEFLKQDIGEYYKTNFTNI